MSTTLVYGDPHSSKADMWILNAGLLQTLSSDNHVHAASPPPRRTLPPRPDAEPCTLALNVSILSTICARKGRPSYLLGHDCSQRATPASKAASVKMHAHKYSRASMQR